jgi:hypothetical protein
LHHSPPASKSVSKMWRRSGSSWRIAPAPCVHTAAWWSPEPAHWLLTSRTRTGSGPKAENSGQNTAPAFRVPSAAMYSSGIRPARTQIRSPRLTPKSLQQVGEAVAQPGQIGIAELAPLAIFTQPAQRSSLTRNRQPPSDPRLQRRCSIRRRASPPIRRGRHVPGKGPQLSADESKFNSCRVRLAGFRHFGWRCPGHRGLAGVAKSQGVAILKKNSQTGVPVESGRAPAI